MSVYTTWGDALAAYRRNWWSIAWRGVVAALMLEGIDHEVALVLGRGVVLSTIGVLLLWMITFGFGLGTMLDAIAAVAGTAGSPRAGRMFAAALFPMFIPPFTLLLPTVALENVGVITGIRRSWQLSRGCRCRTAVALMLIPAIIAALIALAGVTTGAALTLVVAGPLVILPLVVPLYVLVQTSMYIALHGPIARSRGERLDALVLQRGLA